MTNQPKTYFKKVQISILNRKNKNQLYYTCFQSFLFFFCFVNSLKRTRLFSGKHINRFTRIILFVIRSVSFIIIIITLCDTCNCPRMILVWYIVFMIAICNFFSITAFLTRFAFLEPAIINLNNPSWNIFANPDDVCTKFI